MIIVGIDEVGRGPIAGPVAVGACALLVPRKYGQFKNFKDSKQLSELSREAWFAKINAAEKAGILSYSVVFVSEKVIDTKGLSYAIRTALARALANLKLDPHSVKVLLDGGLKAPSEYADQTTLIKGDEKELAIALASIAAKVTRDRRMVRLSVKYPGYDLEKHKGYGTKNHYKALKNKGILPIHRRSFLKNFRP